MALGSHKMLRSMSVEQVVKHADEPFFDDYYSPKSWFRSADAMVKQAAVYEHERDLQTAYYLLYRHAKLVLEYLPKHQSAKDLQYRQSWLDARRTVKRTLAKLEALKPLINKRYERYQEKLQAAQTPSSNGRREPPSPSDHIQRESLQLDPSENVDVAVRIANSCFEGLGQRPLHHEGNDLHIALQATKQYVREAETSKAERSPIYARDSAFQYPSVSRSQQSSIRLPPPRSPSNTSQAPSLPPKPSANAAPRPAKPRGIAAQEQPSSHDVQSFAPAAFLEDGTGLRTVFLPRRVRSSFLRLAAPNSARNLETLGLLCGTLVRNAFFVTHLLLPPQTATSDTCEMTERGEELLDAFVSAHSSPDVEPDSAAASALAAGGAAPPSFDLLILGWIHTHPTQTCFLSSRDLHTHVWYQATLPEAVAIVCAPRQAPPGDWGGFRLTNPPGMKIVRECRRPGIFHPHDEPTGGHGLYTDVVGRPGHVVEGELPVEVVDLRDEK